MGRAWYDFWWATAWQAMTVAFSLRTIGHHNLPRAGAALILCNHESFLDPIIVGLAVRRPIRFLARKSLFGPRLLSWFLNSVGVVPVDHKSAGAAEGMRKSIGILQGGEPLVVFPEGERSHDGRMQEFKAGPLLLLKRAPVPVVPVGIAGAYESFPRTAKLPMPSPIFLPATGGAVAASVGPAILPASWHGLEREEALRLFEDSVREQVRRADLIVKK